MSALIRKYRALLHEKPFITNVLTTCTFMSCGDIISQLLLQRREELDLKQTSRFAITGLMFTGPYVRSSFVIIDKLFGPTRTISTLAKKLAVDQLILAPFCIAGNLTILVYLRTKSISEVESELKKTYPTMLKLNYEFWPFVQLANYYFIPLTYRVLFGSTAALAWNTTVSYTLTRSKPE